MSSEANRAYIMEKVDRMLGNNTQTEIDNDEMLARGTTEENAMADIENSLKAEMPQFFYMPDGMKFETYSVDVKAQTAIVQYSYEDQIAYLMVIANIDRSTRLATSDSGNKLKKIPSDLTDGLESTIWEVMEAGDKLPSYIMQWEYKNSYYEFLGKIPEEEISKMAKKILY